MIKVKIQKHLDKATQDWYRTDKDSQIHFVGSFYEYEDKFSGTFKKYFQNGKNGGSYSLNFDSENLDVILDELGINDDEVQYTFTSENGFPLKSTKEEYKAYKITNFERDIYSEVINNILE